MPATKFTDETRTGLIELVGEGLTLKDAATEVDVSQKTLKKWLTRGRQASDGAFADFAQAIDRARAEAPDFDEPMDEGELLVVVSRAARKGSVQAMKLRWEMIRASRAAGDGREPDAFSKLDELDPAGQPQDP